MTKEIFHPRESEVLKIRAFLRIDGSDGQTKDIAGLVKWEQLDEYYRTVKQPNEGHTIEEKALAFYPKDTHKVNGHWIPTWRGMEKMKRLESYRRRLMGRTMGDMNYSSKVVVDSSKPAAWLGTIFTRKPQFDNKADYIKTVEKAEAHRVKQLDRIKILTPAQRKKNTAFARTTYGRRKRRRD